jgi:hypothetical protein
LWICGKRSEPGLSKWHCVLGLLVATAVGRESIDIYAIPLPSIISSWPQVFEPVPPSPYKGLRAFESEDRELFFGRADVVHELTSAVMTGALVPIVGASGVGKSSVINAGLLPLLEEREEGWGFITVRPRPTLPTALAVGLAQLWRSGMPVPVADIEAWQGRISRLGLACAAELGCAATGREHLLVIVDQFEEVLTQDCDQLLQGLAELPEDGMLTVVLALREDSFGSFFVRHAAFGERLRQSAVALRGMDRGELHEAVEGPAALRGVRIVDRLIEELAEAVRDRPGALPLLEFSLDQMWRTLEPGQQALSFDAYEKIGRLDGALTAHADRVLAGLSEAERTVVRRLFVSYLTSPERPDVRRVLRRSECIPGDWQIIVRLANERLLTVGRDTDGNETAEVVHEALLGAWTQLRDWLDAEHPFRSWRQLLRYAMTQRPGAGEGRALLTGELLAASEQWLAERAADLDLDERRLIEMSTARHNEEERRWQVLHHRSAAWRLISAAENADDPVLALLLAIEAVEHTSDAQAIRLVRTCLRHLGAAETAPTDGEAISAASRPDRQRLTLSDWSHGPGADERWLLGDSADSLIVDRQGQSLYGGTRLSMPGPVVAAARERSGIALLGTEAGEVAVWHLADHANQVCSRALGVPVSCVAVSDTGQTLAAACDDGILRVFRGNDLSDIAALSSPGFIRDIDVTNRLVAALSHDRRILVWDLLSQALICESIPGMDACRLAVDPSDDYVLVGNAAVSGYSICLPVSAHALSTWARRAAGRGLTDEERNRYIGEDPV